MSVEFDRGSPGKFDSRTLDRETLNRWTGHCMRLKGANRWPNGDPVASWITMIDPTMYIN